MDALVFLGVFFELISTMSGTVGKQLIRFSEKKRDAGARYASRVALSIGLVLNTAFGPIVDILAYAFAPAVLIAPIGALDIVWNILSAPWTLGEPLTKQRGVSVAIIFTATFCSTLVADHTDSEYTTEIVYELFFRWRFFAYFVISVSWILFNLTYLMRFPMGSIARGFSLATTAGSIAGNLFCVKITVELVKTAIEDGSGEVFTQWIFYAVILCAILFAVSNVAFMTKGLQEYEAIFIVTVYEGSMVTVNSLSALVVLGEMDNKPVWRLIAYIACLLGLIAGQAYLVAGEKIHKEDIRETEMQPVSEVEEEEETGNFFSTCCDPCEESEESDEDIEDEPVPVRLPLQYQPAVVGPVIHPTSYQRF